ncbi:hypothetical protein B484DRAFT_463112, partial [Ochromonadaceae sp. CCMP2298]
MGGLFKGGNQNWKLRRAVSEQQPQPPPPSPSTPPPPPPIFQFSSPCPSVNTFISQNWAELVNVALEQYILSEIVLNAVGFISSCTHTAPLSGECAFSPLGFTAHFRAEFDITWPKRGEVPPFFFSTGAGQAVFTEEELGVLVERLLALDESAAKRRLAELNREVYSQVLGNVLPRSQRSIQGGHSGHYLLLQYLIDRVNFQSGYFSALGRATKDGIKNVHIEDTGDLEDTLLLDAVTVKRQDDLRAMIFRPGGSLLFEPSAGVSYRMSTAGVVFYRNIAIKNAISPDNMMGVVNSVFELVFACPAPLEVLRCERGVEAAYAQGQYILEQALLCDISQCQGSGCCVGSDDTHDLGEEKKCVEVSYSTRGGVVQTKLLAVITVASKKAEQGGQSLIDCVMEKANLLYVGSAVADNAFGAQNQNRLLLAAADEYNALHRSPDDLLSKAHRVLFSHGCKSHFVEIYQNAADAAFIGKAGGLGSTDLSQMLYELSWCWCSNANELACITERFAYPPPQHKAILQYPGKPMLTRWLTMQTAAMLWLLKLGMEANASCLAEPDVQELIAQYDQNNCKELLRIPFQENGGYSLLMCLAYMMMKRSKNKKSQYDTWHTVLKQCSDPAKLFEASVLADLRPSHLRDLAFVNSKPPAHVFGEAPCGARMREWGTYWRVSIFPELHAKLSLSGNAAMETKLDFCVRRQEILDGSASNPEFRNVMENRYTASMSTSIGKVREYCMDIPAEKVGEVLAYLGDAVLGPIVAEEVLRVLDGPSYSPSLRTEAVTHYLEEIEESALTVISITAYADMVRRGMEGKKELVLNVLSVMGLDQAGALTDLRKIAALSFPPELDPHITAELPYHKHYALFQEHFSCVAGALERTFKHQLITSTKKECTFTKMKAANHGNMEATTLHQRLWMMNNLHAPVNEAIRREDEIRLGVSPEGEEGGEGAEPKRRRSSRPITNKLNVGAFASHIIRMVQQNLQVGQSYIASKGQEVPSRKTFHTASKRADSLALIRVAVVAEMDASYKSKPIQISDSLAEVRVMNKQELSREGAMPLPCPTMGTLTDLTFRDSAWLGRLLIPGLPVLSSRLLHKQRLIYGLIGSKAPIGGFRHMVKGWVGSVTQRIIQYLPLKDLHKFTSEAEAQVREVMSATAGLDVDEGMAKFSPANRSIKRNAPIPIVHKDEMSRKIRHVLARLQELAGLIADGREGGAFRAPGYAAKLQQTIEV